MKNKKLYHAAIVVSPLIESFLIGLLTEFITSRLKVYHIGEEVVFDWVNTLWLPVVCLFVQVIFYLGIDSVNQTQLWGFDVDEGTKETWEALNLFLVIWTGFIFVPLLLGIVIAAAIVMIAHTDPRVTIVLTYLLSLILCIAFYCARGQKLMKKEDQ